VEVSDRTVTAGRVEHAVIVAVPEILHIDAKFAEVGATFGPLVPTTVAVKVIEDPTLGDALLTTRAAVWA